MAKRMTDETKKKLREHDRRTRQKTVLLKDLAPDDLDILCDQAQELGFGTRMDLDKVRLGYLSRASEEQLQTLRGRLPHAVVMVSAYGGARPRWCFELEALRAICRALSRPRKYLKWFRRHPLRHLTLIYGPGGKPTLVRCGDCRGRGRHEDPIGAGLVRMWDCQECGGKGWR